MTPTVSVTATDDSFPADLAALTSIKAHEGVRRIGGKESAFRKQLRRFREHYPNAINELRQLIATSGALKAEEYCHALKGVTGNLGAHALFETITAINQALKQGKVPDDALLDEAAAQLQRVMREIDTLTSPATPPLPPAITPLPDEAIRALLSRLAYAVEYDLGAAESLLNELRAGVAGTPLEAEVATVTALVDVFDIDAALDHLNSMTARLTQSTT